MDPVLWLMRWADPVLIAPYRWFDDPAWALWTGTAILTVWCTLIGELTMGVALRLNWKFVRKRTSEMVRRHNQSVNALRAGDKELYSGFNKLANEAFGKSFFQNLAMGMGSLWPIFFAAAWLQERFLDVEFPVPGTPWYMPWTGAFAMLYILIRITFAKYLKKRLPFFKQTYRLTKLMAPKRRMDLLRPEKLMKKNPEPGLKSEEKKMTKETSR